jgi:hypothetical protein
MPDLDVEDVRARVVTLLREQGLEYLGPSDDSPWPDYDGKCIVVLIDTGCGVVGMYRAGRPSDA